MIRSLAGGMPELPDTDDGDNDPYKDECHMARVSPKDRSPYALIRISPTVQAMAPMTAPNEW
jgi:hypothetical protein